MKRKKFIFFIVCLLVLPLTFSLASTAATDTYTVVKGDSLWKIAQKYRVGLDEIIAANPQIKDPHWIYPGDRITVPLDDRGTVNFVEEVARLVNIERSKVGLKPLTYDWELARVARYKSKDMQQKNYFSHTSPTYGSPFDMIKSFGLTYRTAGENIAKGYTSPQSVVTGWMNSSGHRANILNASFTRIGVGYESNGHYWTQMFIG